MASGRRDTLNSIQDNSLKKNSTELTMSELQVELAEVLRKRNELVSSGEVSGEDKNPGSLVKRKSESALRGARKNSGEDLDEFLGHHDPRLDSKNVFIPGLDYRVLNPEGKYLKSFGYIILLSLLYIIFAVPFRLAFLDRFSSQESMYLLVIDRFIDCFFVLDIFLNFFTAFKKEDGELEVNRRKIAVKYLKTFFILDLLAVLPFEYMQQDNNVGVVGPAFRFPRIIRIIRLVKVFRSHAYKDLIQHFVLDNAIDASIARIFWIFCILVIFVHFGACFWYFWGTLYENNNQNAWTQRTWLQDSTSDSVNYHYLLSVYWCLTTLTTVGYGDITARTTSEMIWSIIMQLSGAIVLAYITATVASIIAATDRDSKFLEEKIYNINAFCKHRKIPTELRNRIIQNAMHQSRNSGIAVAWTSVMSELPQYIRYKITSEVFDDLLTMPFFRKLRLYGPIFEEFISSLEPEHFAKGEYIAREDETATKLYFIRSGKVEARSKESKHLPFYRFEAGSIQGDIPLLLEPTWTYSLVCAKNTETAFIAKEKLFSIFNADVNLNLWMRETAQENQVEYNQKLHVISRKEKKNIERKQMSTKSNAEIPQGKQPEVQIDSGKIIPRAISLPKSQKIGRKLSVRLPEGSQRSPSWGSERSDNTLSPKGLEIPSIDLLERKAQELMLRLDTVVGKIEIIDQILNDTKQ